MVKDFVKFGKQPASPAPNRNRVTAIEVKLHAQPVAAVKNDHQHTPRAHAVAEVPARNLEQGIGQRERGEHVAHLFLAEAQITGDVRSGLRDADAIDVSDHRERDREYNYQIPDTRRGLR